MAKEFIDVEGLSGYMGACLCDSASGMMLLSSSASNKVDLEIASAVATVVVQATREGSSSLGADDAIEDILITTGEVYHLMRTAASDSNLFVYLVLDKKKGNLALARMNLVKTADSIKV